MSAACIKYLKSETDLKNFRPLAEGVDQSHVP